ncbi:MAG: hypothetical protein S4CHLAM102_06580 [Chlamydiia bacterium]|nr:hypothetical protein [Chlamydiia bacterium]
MHRLSKHLTSLVFTALWCPAAWGTIQLHNDTHYPLEVQIFNRMGEPVGQLLIEPGIFANWYNNQSPYEPQPNFPYTPYTVRWMCVPQKEEHHQSSVEKHGPPSSTPQTHKEEKPQYEMEFSVWYNVPTGAAITAQGAPDGAHTCKIRKKKKKEEEPNWTENKALLPTNPSQAPAPLSKEQ